MVAADGGIFNFGNSVFLGSRPQIPEASGEIRSPVTCVEVLADRITLEECDLRTPCREIVRAADADHSTTNYDDTGIAGHDR